MGMTLFQVVYGQEPPPLLPYVYNVSYSVPVIEWLFNHDKILQQLKINLTKAWDMMKKLYWYVEEGNLFWGRQLGIS